MNFRSKVFIKDGHFKVSENKMVRSESKANDGMKSLNFFKAYFQQFMLWKMYGKSSITL